MGRRVGILVGAIALASAALAVLPAAPAGAHSALVSSEPANGAAVADVGRIVLRFSEPVEAAGSHILIHDGREAQSLAPVRRGPDDRTLEVDLPPILDGAYTVVWHVLAGDGDPVAGELTFSQTSPAAAAAAIPSSPTTIPRPEGAHAHAASGVPAAIMRLVATLAIALLLGGFAFVAVVWPAGARVPRVHRLLAAYALVGVLSSLGHAALLHLAARSGSWTDLLDVRFGRVALARVLLLAGLGISLQILLRGGERTVRALGWRIGTGALAVGLLESIVLLGHGGRAGGVDGVTRLVHAAGMSAWIGGLALLVGVVLPRRRTDELRTVLPRFSVLATVAVGTLVLAGVVLSVDLVGAAEALGGSTYGRILTLKLLVVAALLGVASRSRARVRARVEGGDVAVLSRLIGLELGVIAVVFALTAALVATAPPA